jgi:transcriptional regulator with XRE-family HTH domain
MKKANSSAQALGEAIRLERLKSGMSQEVLAFTSGLHRTYIGSVERGERNVSLRNIVAISKALGLASAAELLSAAKL